MGEALERALQGRSEGDVEESVVADATELAKVAGEAAHEAASLDPQKSPTRRRSDVAESLAAREAALAAQLKGRRRVGPNDFEERVPTIKGRRPVK
jgi:hypothetical protein